MKPTTISALIACTGFCAVASFILVARFFGALGAVPAAVAVTLWAMAALCTLLAVRVKNRVNKNRVGLDRSQLNPLDAANMLIVGKASAWTGAIFGGAYIGMALYVLPRMGSLIAADEEAPRVVAAALGGVAMCIAGYYLERSCSVPPPKDGEAA